MQESESLRSENAWICIGILLHTQLEELEGGLAQATSALVKHWLTSTTTCAGWTLILGIIIIVYCELFFILKQRLYKKLVFFEVAMVKGLRAKPLSNSPPKRTSFPILMHYELHLD